jgi:hypothetical protein
VSSAVMNIIYKAHAIASKQKVGIATLQLLGKKEFGGSKEEGGGKKPFYTRHMVKTIIRYTGYWLVVLHYIW